MTKTILVWYFLNVAGYYHPASVIGPFISKDQCLKFAAWTQQYSHISDCYEAPLANAASAVEDCQPKLGCNP